MPDEAFRYALHITAALFQIRQEEPVNKNEPAVCMLTRMKRQNGQMKLFKTALQQQQQFKTALQKHTC